MSDAPAAQNVHADRTAEIVAAYVGHNHIAPSDVPALIRSVHGALSVLDAPAEPQAAAEPPKPAVSVNRSVTEDYIVSLEDGRKLKSMKRYLAGLGMTPADYRAKWGLPNDYPMVAPAYAKARSALAKTLGLGRKRAAAAPQPAPAVRPAPAKAKRGRKAA